MQFILDDDSGVKYVAALRLDFFNMGNMTKLQDSGHVTGIIVLRSSLNLPQQGFSPDKTCPNDGFGLYAGHKEYSSCKKVSWNAKNPGTDMFFTRWNFPIFLVDNETSIDIIVNQCFNKYNTVKDGKHVHGWPLCAAQLKSRMSGAKDSVTCIRRSENVVTMNPMHYCDPLTDRNVISTLYATSNEKPVSNRSVVVVGARLDTFSMFDGLSPGADSAVSGFVTLLIAAQMLNQLKVSQQPQFVQNNVLFALFNGEAFDYIGSSRIVYDMEKGRFPLANKLSLAKMQPASLALHHISHFVELSQVAPLGDEDSTVYLHTDPVSAGTAEVNQTVKELVDEIKTAASTESLQLPVKTSPADQPLPPSSVQRFLKKDKGIAAVVITNHDQKFRNRYYNSFLDNWENLNATGGSLEQVAEHLTKLAATVATAVFKLVTGKDAKGLALDKFRTAELLECYILNATCALFGEVTKRAFISAEKTRPFPLYVSVDPHGHNINPSTVRARLIMAYLTGEHLHIPKDNCTLLADVDRLHQYNWMDGPDVNESGICVKSTTMMTLARSPAYELKDWSSREYSTWTESVWEEASLQVFLMPSFRQEVSVLVGGVAVFLVSLLTVHCLHRQASVLFTPRALVGI